MTRCELLLPAAAKMLLLALVHAFVDASSLPEGSDALCDVIWGCTGVQPREGAEGGKGRQREAGLRAGGVCWPAGDGAGS